MKTFAISLTIIIIYTLTVIDIQAENMVSECGCHPIPMNMSGIPDPNAEKFGTKKWLTDCYNDWDIYEERIRFCS